jgi:Zn-dependent protease
VVRNGRTIAVFELQPTPFDLRWRMLGTDVRVHPTFWLFSAILGWDFFERHGFSYLVIWVLCSFASILLHEFGHVMMAWPFGSRGHILLYSFGGLAIGVNAWKRWQRILIAFAGPAIQFVLSGLIRLTLLLLPLAVLLDMPKPAGAALGMLLFINWAWPLLNLLPIWPLDGGQITREVFEAIWKTRGLLYSLMLSGGLAVLLALHSFMVTQGRPLIPYLPFGGMWSAILFAMLAIGSFQMWAAENQRLNRSSRYDDDRLPWE